MDLELQAIGLLSSPRAECGQCARDAPFTSRSVLWLDLRRFFEEEPGGLPCELPMSNPEWNLVSSRYPHGQRRPRFILAHVVKWAAIVIFGVVVVVATVHFIQAGLPPIPTGPRFITG